MRRIIGTARYLQGNLNEKMVITIEKSYLLTYLFFIYLFIEQVKRLGFHTTPPTEFPKKEEYDREQPPHVPGSEPRIRRMKDSWQQPRYYQEIC